MLNNILLRNGFLINIQYYLIAVDELNWSPLGVNWLFVLSESLLVLRSKQSGKYWEGSTYKYSLRTYSVQGPVVLEYIELSRQCFCPQPSRGGGGLGSLLSFLLLLLLQLWWVRSYKVENMGSTLKNVMIHFASWSACKGCVRVERVRGQVGEKEWRREIKKEGIHKHPSDEVSVPIKVNLKRNVRNCLHYPVTPIWVWGLLSVRLCFFWQWTGFYRPFQMRWNLNASGVEWSVGNMFLFLGLQRLQTTKPSL